MFVYPRLSETRQQVPQAWRTPIDAAEARGLLASRDVVFDLRRLDGGGLVHRYPTEGSALAFVRDVVRIAGHEQAACFLLEEQDAEGKAHTIAQGADLVRRALEDRAQ